MKTFFKANVASMVASFCDYLLTFSLVQFLLVDKLLALIAGTVFGGIVNFFISRHWAFKGHNSTLSAQGKRYFIVWLGNLILNASGSYVLIKLLKVEYIIVKVVTSLFVAITYNYPIQKRYVFKISE